MRLGPRFLLALSILPLASSTVAQPAGETAVLAGGCFWGMEAVFEHVKGVQNVVSGYAGGAAEEARYDKVSSERTEHAEAIRISFDPRQVSYAQLLRIYFSGRARPDAGEPAGPGRRPELSLGDLPAEWRATAARREPSSPNCARRRTRSRRGSKAAPSIPRRPIIRISCAENPLHPYVLVNDRPKLAKLKQRLSAILEGLTGPRAASIRPLRRAGPARAQSLADPAGDDRPIRTASCRCAWPRGGCR